MSVHGQMIGHLVRRGISTAQTQLSEVGPNVSENTGSPVMEIEPREYWPVALVVVIAMIGIASVCTLRL